MISLFRADERHYLRGTTREQWRTFHARGPGDPLAGGFGALATLDEDRLGPGQRRPRRPTADGELVTYVRDGALAVLDSRGDASVIHAGEFRRAAAHRDLRHGVSNASRTAWAHAFHIGLSTPGAMLEAGAEQRRFVLGDRRGGLNVVASPDGRHGSLRLHADVVIHAATLARDQPVAYALAPGRAAWVHVLHGEATLAHHTLTSGDGAGVTSEAVVALVARQVTELLLVDLRHPPPGQP